jgi:NAD-dependent DNA ligase
VRDASIKTHPRTLVDIEYLANRFFTACSTLSCEKLATLLSHHDIHAILYGWGDKSSSNIIAALEKSKNRDLHTLVRLVIRQWERHGATLARHFGSIDALMTATAKNSNPSRIVGPTFCRRVIKELDPPSKRSHRHRETSNS